MQQVKIETALTTFDVKEAVLADLESSIKLEIADKESEGVVRKYRQQAKSLQVQIEKRRLQLNREYKDRTDKAAEILTTRINPVYDDLDGKIKVVEAEREAKRLEREAAEKAEQERLEKIEAERVLKIEQAIVEIETAAIAGQKYYLQTYEIKSRWDYLANMPLNKDVLQEKYDDAVAIWKKGMADTEAAFNARLKFEQEQAAQKAEKKRLADERAKFEAEQKAAREKAEAAAKAEREKWEAEERERRRVADEASEKARLEAEQIKRDREALEKEKADILAAKMAEEAEKAEAEQYAADWDMALVEDKDREKTRKEKQKADKARAKLIAFDRDMLTGFMQKIKAPVFDYSKLKTEEGKDVFLSFARDFDAIVDSLKTEIENLS